MVKMMKTLALTLIAGLMTVISVGFASDAEAGKKKYKKIYTLQQIVNRLYETGHYNVRITDRKPPYYDFDVCKGGKEYELTIDHKGNVKDRDYEGRCRMDKKSRRKAKADRMSFDKGRRAKGY